MNRYYSIIISACDEVSNVRTFKMKLDDNSSSECNQTIKNVHVLHNVQAIIIM